MHEILIKTHTKENNNKNLSIIKNSMEILTKYVSKSPSYTFHF